MLRPKLIRIRKIMGIEDLEIQLGKVTILEGGNATGKSSVLEGLKSIVDGGHDATLLREGEEEGEAVLVLEERDEDGEPGPRDGVEIRKRVTRGKSDLRVKHPKTGTVSGPKGYVESLINAVAFNPVRFITSDDRVELLLEALDPEVSEQDLLEAVDGVETDQADLPGVVETAAKLPALEAIESVRGVVYDERTGVNRVAREKRATAKQLTESLPAEGADPDEIRAELEEAESNLEAERTERTQRRDRITERYDEELESIRSKRDERVEVLQREIEKVRGSAQEAIEETKDARAEDLSEVDAMFGEEISQRQDLVTTLRERLRTAEGAEGTRENIRDAEAAAERHESLGDAMTAAIERLDALKERTLKDLPIEGAEIRDGELYVGGVHFDRLNTQRRAEISVEVADMLAGELGLVVIDDLELLDREHFEAMVERIKGSRLTAIVTRVAQDGSELSVSAENGDAERQG